VRAAVSIALLTLACAAAASASGPTPAAAGATAAAIAPADFIAALQRARSSLPEPPDPPALKAYPIYDYLIAARLRRDLEFAPTDDLDTTIDAFLRAHEGQPVAHTLKHQWLVSLAQRRRWDWFLPRSADATDPVLVCDRLAGRLATGDADKAGGADRFGADALARWSLPQRLPIECAPVLAWLRTQGLITPALLESRARAALAADNPTLAREFVAEVPAPRAGPLDQWLQLLETPKIAVTALAAAPDSAVEPEALLAGFTRLSNTDAAAAATLLPEILARPDTTPALRGRLQRAQALGAAYARQPGAVVAFDAVPQDLIDTPVREWRVRAALWAGDFPKVLEWTEDMPPSLATQPKWRYWRARAVAATGGAEAAAPLYAALAGTRDYYGYLAADRLHQSYNLNIRPTSDDAAVQAALAADPGLVRAHALFDCDMADDAAAEWNAVLSTARPATRIQAARLASRWGWYAQAIAMLAQADSWDDVPLRYPRPYLAVVAGASRFAQVPEDWILAIIRQESLYRKDAVSRADARGLMQMQPATAGAVARRWHLAVPGRDALFDPAVAVPLGAAYVHELLERYGNQLELCLAAYNAGPVSVARWLPAQPIDADVWIENIPYTETRGYVQHVLEHIVAFAAMRDAEPPRLSGLLQPVRAPAAVSVP
jgi:peptidoglycan lytic transglycosylase